jgi:hypothetical protein
VILTSAVVVMIIVAMTYANGYLNTQMAANEFSTSKQFMLTTGLQIDDIAWMIGRTQTIRYTSTYGQMKFQNSSLSYSFEVYLGSQWQQIANFTTGMIMLNMPTSAYTLGNNYFQRIFPSSNNSFLQQGASAPVGNVFIVEKLPMNDGNYTRIVVVPSIRMLTSTVAGTQPLNYYRFYLPTLQAGPHPYNSQSITLTGTDVMQITQNGASQIRINVTFPNGGSLGFDSGFFNFQDTSIVMQTLSNSVVEIYSGNVTVSLGLYT